MTSSKEKDKHDDDQVKRLIDFMNHETRITLVERAIIGIEEKFKSVDKRFDKVEQKLETQFKWTIAMFLSVQTTILTMFGGIILRMAHII